MTKYDSEVDTLRDITIVDQIKVCEKFYLKHLKRDICNATDISSVKVLREKGYKPITNSFLNATLGVNNHIYNTPTDMMN